jgi:hypothetical protein
LAEQSSATIVDLKKTEYRTRLVYGVYASIRNGIDSYIHKSNDNIDRHSNINNHMETYFIFPSNHSDVKQLFSLTVAVCCPLLCMRGLWKVYIASSCQASQKLKTKHKCTRQGCYVYFRGNTHNMHQMRGRLSGVYDTSFLCEEENVSDMFAFPPAYLRHTNWAKSRLRVPYGYGYFLCTRR